MQNLLEVRYARQSLREVEHYLHASPLGDLAFRFLSYCEPFTLEDDRCWEWKGTTNSNGYGHLHQGTGYGTKARANRVSYALFREPIQINPGQFKDTLLVCHTCDNKKCVRPSHFFLGTPKENLNDYFFKVREGKRIDKRILSDEERAARLQKAQELMAERKAKREIYRERLLGFIQGLRDSRFTIFEIGGQCGISPRYVENYVSELIKRGHHSPSSSWNIGHKQLVGASIRRQAKANELRAMKLAIGQKLYWLWSAREEVVVTRRLFYKKENKERFYQRTKTKRTHEKLVRKAVRTISLVLECKEAQVWRMVQPGREKELTRHRGNRIKNAPK